VGEEAPHVSVVSVLRLRARDGAADELVLRFAQLEIFERARESGGFLGGRLLRAKGGGAEFTVIADWETHDDYQAWLDNPVRAETGAQLEPLLADEVTAGELYEVVG
jgi:heme-degrading monooxygenase HmoA